MDLGGLSFPRRLGVRFSPDFIKRYHLMGLQCRWQSYHDDQFKESMGKDFYHEDMITREGWAMYYFKGKYPKDTAYVKMQVVNPQTGMQVRTFYFQFKKSYLMSLDARYYITDPVLGTKVVKDGTLIELRPMKKPSGETVYRPGSVMFPQQKIRNLLEDGEIVENGEVEDVKTRAVIMTTARYSETPKAIFLVTPPHLMKYAKLILILIKQLVDLNFEKSYMTKSSQKPLLKTRFMLDELGLDY